MKTGKLGRFLSIYVDLVSSNLVSSPAGLNT